MTKKDFRDMELITSQIRGETLKGSLIDLFEDAIDALTGEDFAIAGAFALHAYVEPRATRDLDLVVLGEKASIEKKLLNAGFIKGTDFNVGRGSLRIIRFLKYDRILDVMIFQDKNFSKELLKTSNVKTILEKPLKTLSADGLALTKLMAWRDQDIVDLKNLSPQLNRTYLESWTKKLKIPSERVNQILSKYPLVDEILKNDGKK